MTHAPIPRGLRVFTCGHSFHHFTAELIADCAVAAGITDHVRVGDSGIGRSEAMRHWEVPDADNHAKRALRAGAVDVLTLSCMAGPDEGIDLFARLAAEHSPTVRVHLQALWLPEDRYPFDAANRVRSSIDHFNETDMDTLRATHARYVADMSARVEALNREIGRQIIVLIPDYLGALALRDAIRAGQAPGLSRPSELFLDPWGHASPPLRLLAGYNQYAAIYRRSPEGLPLHPSLAGNPAWDLSLHRLLQRLAWDAARSTFSA